MKQTLIISWVAVRELLYEKVFYLLVFFALAGLGLTFLLGQMTYGEQTKLTLDFMLAGIQLSMVLFSIFIGISLFQRELQMGSIAMVLSKPISRSSFLIGKYLGQVAVQSIVIAFMTTITLVTCPGLSSEAYAAILQACWLILLEVTVVTAIAYTYAVNLGPLIAAMGSLAFFLLGHFAPITTPKSGSPESFGLTLIKAFVPKLELFNMKAIASYGFGITLDEIGLASLYALLMISAFLTIASITFNQRDILT